MPTVTEYQYIIDSNSLKQRYDRINQIITSLENQLILAATTSDVDNYSLNDGQIQIRTQYRSPDSIIKAITGLEVIANRLEAQLTGTRVMRLADAESVQSNGIVRRF